MKGHSVINGTIQKEANLCSGSEFEVEHMCKQRPVPVGHGIALVITFLSNCNQVKLLYWTIHVPKGF